MTPQSRSDGHSEPDYALLQQHQFALLAAEHEELLDADVPRIRLVPNAFNDSAALMPALVKLDLLDAPKRQTLVDNLLTAYSARTAPMFSALLSTSASEQSTIAHLTAAQLRTSRDGRRAWLRIHDPRVWIQLPRVLPPGRIRDLFGPITAWTVYLRGHWTTTTPPVDRLRTHSATEQTDTAVWAALERIGLVNRVLAHCGWADFDSSVEHGAAVDALLMRGQKRYGLTRQDDLVEYAILGLRVHPRFDEHPVAFAAIQSEQAGLTTSAPGFQADASCVVDALRSISEVDWERVRAELCR